jgi:hypothetical protein
MTWDVALESKYKLVSFFLHVHGYHGHFKFMLIKCYLLLLKFTIFFNLYGIDLKG